MIGWDSMDWGGCMHVYVCMYVRTEDVCLGVNGWEVPFRT